MQKKIPKKNYYLKFDKKYKKFRKVSLFKKTFPSTKKSHHCVRIYVCIIMYTYTYTMFL